MLLNPQPCPVCETLLVPLKNEEDPADILYLCPEMTCQSKDSEGQLVWDLNDLKELREAKQKYGSLTKNGKEI